MPSTKRTRFGMLGATRAVTRQRAVLGRVGHTVVPFEQNFVLTAGAGRGLYDDPAHAVGESHRLLNNKSCPFIPGLRLDFNGDYASSIKVNLSSRARMECGVCSAAGVRHGLGGGARVALFGDQFLPAVVGAAPDSDSSSACMPVFRICNADEDSIFNFIVALHNSKRTWNTFGNGAILFIQSFSWMIDCGSASVYLEGIQNLRDRVIRHFGLDKSTGQPWLEVVPAVIPVPVRNEVEAKIFSAYLELSTMIKDKNLFPILCGPVWEIYQLDNKDCGESDKSGGPDLSGGSLKANVSNHTSLTTTYLKVNGSPGPVDSEPSKQVLQEIKDYFDSQGISLDSRNSKTTGTLGGG